MSLLDRFKQSKKDEVNLPKTDSLDQDSSFPDTSKEDDPFSETPDDNPFDTTTNVDPMRGQSQQQASDDGLRQDVKLVLERLDTVKSQLSSIQHRLDSLESKHDESNRKKW